MKNKVVVTIADRDYTMVAVEDENYVRKCAQHVDQQLREIANSRISQADAAVLAAMAGGRTLTPALLRELCVRLGGGDRGEVEEDFPRWAVTALPVCRGRLPEDTGALARAVERLKPAHLAVAVLPAAELETAPGIALHGGVLTVMTAQALPLPEA